MKPGALFALLLIGLTGAAVSLGLYNLAQTSLQRDQLSQFTRLASSRSGVIAQMLRLSEESAANIHGLFLASTFVDHEEFQLFSRIQHRRNTSVHALQWVPVVPGAERDAFEKKSAELIGRDYRIREFSSQRLLVDAAQRDDYFPVRYVVPLKVNETLLGLDLGSESVRRATLELARDSGLTQATPPLALAQEIDPAPGVLIVNPVYRGPRSTSKERRANLQGFVVVTVRVKTVLQNAIYEVRQTESGIYTELYDVNKGKETFLYAAGADQPARLDSAWLLEEEVPVAGRTWRVRNYPGAEFLRTGATWQPVALGATGLGLTLVMLVFVYNLTQREQQIRQEVDTRTRELRRSEAQIRGLLDAATNAIFVLDEDGRIRSSNPAARTLFPVAPGGQPSEFFPDLFPNVNEEKLLACNNLEVSVTGPRNQPVHLQVSVSSMQSAGEQSRIAVLNDVTDRLIMERVEREQRRLLQNIMQSMEEGLIVAREGQQLIVNPKTTTLFPNISALSSSRPIPNHAGWLDAESHEPILEESLPIHRIRRGESVQNEEYFVQNERQPDGVHLEVTGTPLLDHEQRRIGAMVVLRDISHRKQYEQKLRDTAEKLAISNQELDSFARAASHDLQEPLRKVQRFGTLLRMTHADQLGEKGLDYLDRMINAADRMSNLITALLSLSRVTSKAQPFEPVNLEELLTEVLDDLQVRIEETGGEVLHEPLPTINADPVQIRQLLQNLISNGLKYQPEGNRPQVRIHAERTVTGENADQLAWAIHVQDNGIGFDQDNADRIFGVFTRLHGRQSYEGSGVGLSICKKIAERHRGSISATSAPGAGATFTVVLPEHQEP